jgi:hypothetical protein
MCLITFFKTARNPLVSFLATVHRALTCRTSWCRVEHTCRRHLPHHPRICPQWRGLSAVLALRVRALVRHIRIHRGTHAMVRLPTALGKTAPNPGSQRAFSAARAAVFIRAPTRVGGAPSPRPASRKKARSPAGAPLFSWAGADRASRGSSAQGPRDCLSRRRRTCFV